MTNGGCVVGACVSVPRKTSSSFFSSCLHNIQHTTTNINHVRPLCSLCITSYVEHGISCMTACGTFALVRLVSLQLLKNFRVRSNQIKRYLYVWGQRRVGMTSWNSTEWRIFMDSFLLLLLPLPPFSSSSPRLPFSDAVMDGLLMDGHQQASPCHNRNKLLEQGVLTILVPMANCREILLRWCMQCFPLYLLSWLRDMSMILLNQGINRYVRWLCYYDVAFFVTAFRCPILVRHPDV
jgi:hypothetical protein